MTSLVDTCAVLNAGRDRLLHDAECWTQGALMLSLADARDAVQEMAMGCHQSYWSAHASGLDPGNLYPEVPLAQRGVDVRTVMTVRDRDTPSARSFADRLRRAGGIVRCTKRVWCSAAVYDGSTAVLRFTRPDAGLVITSPSVLGVVLQAFEATWVAAHDVAGSVCAADPPPAQQSVLSAELLEVARMLATGCTDEVGSRRVGVSLRTYRRRVATLLVQLRVTSRFAAGQRVEDLQLLRDAR